MYYKLISENEKCYLFCEVDMDTIDDDIVDCKYEQNDGTWSSIAPHYWKVNGEELTHLLDELKMISSIEWDVISQYLIECEDDDELHQFVVGGVDLLITSNFEVIK